MIHALGLNMKKQILLVDDHTILRQAMRGLIEAEPDLCVGAEAGSGQEALKWVRQKQFDAVVLDISMPDKNGIDTVRDLKHIAPDLAVLILSGYAADQYALGLIRLGCKGYLSIDADPEEMVRAIRQVSQGKHYFTPEVAELMSQQLIKPNEKPLHEELSEREFQVFIKLASGRSATEIADELFISVKTVSTYRSRILEKMGLKTNADMTYYAIKNGLVD